MGGSTNESTFTEIIVTGKHESEVGYNVQSLTFTEIIVDKTANFDA